MTATTSTTPDTTAQFFDQLNARGQEPLLGNMTTSLRFDLTSGPRTEHWLITVKQGDVSVSRRNGRADCVVRGDKELFDEIAAGHANLMANFLRGRLTVEGNAAPLVRFQRLFPGPKGPSGPPSEKKRGDS